MHVDVVERDVARELEPHHDHPGDPQEEDVARRREHVGGVEGRSSGVSSGQPSVANGHSADENQVSSTSGSRSQPVALRRLVPHVGLRRRGTRPGSGGPTRAGARCTRAGCSPASRGSAGAGPRGGCGRARRGRPRSPARPARPCRMNHCSEISGSIRSPERCENGTSWRVGLGAGDPALLAQRVDDRLARLQRGHAREALAGRLGHAAVLADHGDLLEPVRRPISKSFGSCPGVIFSAPVPNSGLT